MTEDTTITGNRTILHLADPLDVLMANIEHQFELYDKDKDQARLKEIKRMEVKALYIEYTFKTNMN